jgi:2-polyprenyl-3-methyl-5-hydroxy-6-metoxy-1,4-benzoquinol methylase
MVRWKYYEAPHFHELAFLFPPQSIWRARSFGAILTELRCSGKGARTLLDVGCGTGVLPKKIALKCPGIVIKAIDLSPHMINYARRAHSHPSIDYRIQSFWEEDGCYDRVTSTYCWYFFPLERAAKKLKKILNPNGCALIVATRGTPATRMHRRIFSSISGQDLRRPEEITGSLEDEGFSTEWRIVDRTEGSYLVVAALAPCER